MNIEIDGTGDSHLKLIPRLLKELNKYVDCDRIEIGKQRQTAVWHWSPLGVKLGAFAAAPHFSLEEQFYIASKMFYEYLWDLLGIAISDSDAQLAIRPNLGVGIVASIFGADVLIPRNAMPWVTNHLTRPEIDERDVEGLDISKAGLLPRVADYLKFFQNQLRGLTSIKAYLEDIQGPCNIAFLILGNRLFTDIYDDPNFVHRLMQKCTDLFIKTGLYLKTVLSEPVTSGYHGSLYMPDGGIRVVDDCSVLLSTEHFCEFVKPYLIQAFSSFGGGWVHFCGKATHLLDHYLEIPEVKAINLGNPELYDSESLMNKVQKYGKALYGGWPRMAGEELDSYLRRMLDLVGKSRRGLIFKPIVESLTKICAILALNDLVNQRRQPGVFLIDKQFLRLRTKKVSTPGQVW